MAIPKWEEYKMKEHYKFISIDEIIIFIIGLSVFLIDKINNYELYFIGLVIIWYWLKIRSTESAIHKKKQTIYNIFYEKCRPVPMDTINKEVEKASKPLNYELEQLENKRKFLVDKFVIINLILIILIQLFITK